MLLVPNRISFLCCLDSSFISHVKHTGQINAAELRNPNDVYHIQQVQTLAFVAPILFISGGRGLPASPKLQLGSKCLLALAQCL